MASKLKIVRESQKTYWEKKLNARIEVLKGSGLGETDIQRDIVVRKLKAKVKDTISRIRAITAKDEKIKEMARLKEEKKAAPVVKEKGKKAAPEAPAPKKEKKAKGEKTAKEPKVVKEPKAEKEPAAEKELKAEKEPKAEKKPKAPKEPKPEKETVKAEEEPVGTES